MEYTRDSYVGNGSTSIFSITFSFLKNSEIRATINGTLTTSFVFVSSDQIQFLTAPANGAIIDIFRETDDTQLAATLSQGSTIRSSDLNENFNQAINLIQEVDSNTIAGFIGITDELTTTTATANAALPKAGGTMTGAIVLPADPSTNLQAATKQYVDAVGAGAAGLALLKTGGTMTGNLVFAAGQPTATTSTKNIVQLTDSASSTSTTTAATPAAVKVAKDAADAAQSTANTGVSNAASAQTTANAALPKSGGTMTGNLEIGTAGSLTFEGATADGFETTLAVVDPTADRTITLPNVTGTVVTTGDTGTITSTMIANSTITDDDISGGAGIADFKLGTITAAGKVSNSATTATSANTASAIVARDASGNFSAGTITASLTGNASTVTTNANLTGDVTSVGNATAIAAGVIVDADVNASAAIADTKLATIATAGKVSNSATTAASANTASAIVARDASGNFTAGTITAALTGAASSNVLKAGDTMTGALAVTAGTAALPGIAVSGDLNTGIYSPGADQLALSTGGTGRIIVDASGNVNIDSNTLYVDAANNQVGVNTTSPVGSLHSVAAATNAALTLTTPSTGNTRLAHLYGGNSYSYGVVGIVAGNGTFTGDVYGLGSSSNPTGSFSPTLVWTTSAGQNVPGRVGIGTTSPGGTVDIQAAASTAPLIIQGPSSEFARIDSSGRLLVGTSSARSNVNLQAGDRTPFVQIETATDSYNNGISIINNSGGGYAPQISLGLSLSTTIGSNVNVAPSTAAAIGMINFVGNDGDQFLTGARIEAITDAVTGNNDMPCRLVFSTTADGAASPTPRMQIGSTGQSLFFTASTSSSVITRNGAAAGTSVAFLIGAYSATGLSDGTNSFIVWTNGNVVNTNNSYGAISDIKLKENIVDATSQWNDLKALQVRKYNFKEGQTHTQIGLVAQEVELVSPGLVTESPDRDEEGNDLGTVTKSVNYSVLYMKAVKALQEAMERIETLEASNADMLARLTALEAA